MSDPRLHMIAVTGIVVRDGKFLILKRSENEKAYPGMWTVPGGKLVRHEYESSPLSAYCATNPSSAFMWALER